MGNLYNEIKIVKRFKFSSIKTYIHARMFDSIHMYPKIPIPQENMNIKSTYDITLKI